MTPKNSALVYPFRTKFLYCRLKNNIHESCYALTTASTRWRTY